MQKHVFRVYFHTWCKIIEGIEANCLDALEFSLLFCYSLTCIFCLLKLTCPLKIALKCLPFKVLILHPVFMPEKYVIRVLFVCPWTSLIPLLLFECPPPHGHVTYVTAWHRLASWQHSSTKP